MDVEKELSNNNNKNLCLQMKETHIYTISILFAAFAQGLGLSVIGPALQDYAEILRTSLSNVTYGLAASGIGYCASTLLAGFTFGHLNRQLVYSACLMFMGASLLIASIQRHVYIFMAFQAVIGACTGATNVAENAWLIEMWQASSNPYLQSKYFMSFIGLTLGPLIISPFLSSGHMMHTQDDIVGTTSRIMIPSCIITFLIWSSSLIILLLYVKKPYKAPEMTGYEAVARDSDSDSDSESKQQEEQQQQQQKQPFYITLTLGCLLLFFYTHVQLDTGYFLPTFVQSIDLHVSKNKAAGMSSVLSAACAASLGISAVIATKVTAQSMLYVSLSLVSLGNVMLLAFANTSEILVWISIMIIGLGMASVLPSMYAFLQNKITISNYVCGVFTFAASIPTLLNQILLGKYIQTYPLLFLYLNLIALTACSIVMIAFRALDAVIYQ